MKRKYEDYIGNVIESCNDGPYKILDIIRDNGRTKARVVFERSNAITICRAEHALNGKIRDPQYGLNYNNIYYSDNYGPYKVLNISKGSAGNPPKITIQFLNTNNIVIVNLNIALDGNVHDDLAQYKIPIDTYLLNEYDRNRRILRLAKEMWRSMMKRCYYEKTDSYKYHGACGVTVCDRWKVFENFLEDMPNIMYYYKWYRYPTMYHLDKDYLQLGMLKNEKIYSLNTCVFLHYKDNINLMIIENQRISQVTQYFGVRLVSENAFVAYMIVNNNYIHLGTYDDEIVAANVYNYWYEYYHNYELIPLLNDVPKIPIKEWISHNRNPKTMCEIIERL